jgi:hypothetical protein
MGFSGFRGKVHMGAAACPMQLDGNGSGNAVDLTDEVTKFTFNETVNVKKYGHDKSYGWQDSVAGIRSAEITIEATVISPETKKYPARCGQVVALELYPFGLSCTPPLTGLALIERISYTVDQERGDPVAYTATLSTKGKWVGLVGDGERWGGFECECSNA